MSTPTVMKKYAPMNVSKVRVPSSDKMFYTAGGRRDYPMWQVVNEFGSSYYSGLDVSVYFGDIFVDEVVQISYSETENVKPIFGYASYIWDCVAHGSRIVQGSFAINFKDAGYIPTMLNLLAKPADVEKAISDLSLAQIANTAQGTAEADAVANQFFRDSYSQSKDWPTELAVSRDLTLEDLITMRDFNKNYRGYDTYDPGKALEGGKFHAGRYERIMNSLKTEHWGEFKDKTSESEARTENFQPKYQMRSTGPMSPSFDVVIKYGQPEDYNSGAPGWGTIEVIKDCHITGFNKAIDDSGRNVIEVYNFIAQTIA